MPADDGRYLAMSTAAWLGAIGLALGPDAQLVVELYAVGSEYGAVSPGLFLAGVGMMAVGLTAGALRGTHTLLETLLGDDLDDDLTTPPWETDSGGER